MPTYNMIKLRWLEYPCLKICKGDTQIIQLSSCSFNKNQMTTRQNIKQHYTRLQTTQRQTRHKTTKEKI